jgi:hypothetical protein
MFRTVHLASGDKPSQSISLARSVMGFDCGATPGNVLAWPDARSVGSAAEAAACERGEISVPIIPAFRPTQTRRMSGMEGSRVAGGEDVSLGHREEVTLEVTVLPGIEDRKWQVVLPRIAWRDAKGEHERKQGLWW